MGAMRGAAAGLLGVALVVTWGAPARAADLPLGGARISAVEGEALVQMGDEGGWRAAPLNMPLLPGDRLQTGATGRLEVLLSNGAAIRLGPAGAARLVAVPPAEPAGDPTAEMDLESGRAILATGDGDRSRATVAVNATGTRIQVYPRSQVRAETVSPDATDVTLREGAATVDALGTSIPLRVGEALQVGRGGALLVASPPQDPFDRWSESRDRTLAAAPPPTLSVPAPLAPSAGELSRYGQWTSVPQYGTVWQPSAIPVGWAPFTTGEWIWRGGTWVWLSAEPWGWVPFHYGRWRWDPFLHWYWVPPQPRLAVWCPGAVAWIRTPSYVTWIPLAPGEIYYSPWPHGVWSAPAPPPTLISITNITIIKKTFVNAAAPVPVVAVPVATFTRTAVVTPAAPPITRVSLASLVANQPAKVVTPAALAPATAGKRPAAPPSAKTTPPVAAPNGAPQARAPLPGAAAPAPRAPQSPTQSTNPGRAGVWGREAGRTPEGAPAQQQWEPARPKVARPTTAFTAPAAAAPRATPEPARPAPIERLRPREEPARPEPRIEREQPRAPSRGREFRPAPHAEPARPAPIERAYPREEIPKPQVRMDRERPQAERHEFRPAPHALEPSRPATLSPAPRPPSQAGPPGRHEAPRAVAPPQVQDRGHHVAQAPPAPQPAKPSKSHPAPPEQPAHPATVR